MKNLLILGAGQYGMVAREIVESMELFNTIEFLDDNNPSAVGKLDDYKKLSGEYSCAVVAIGDPEIRLKLIGELGAAGYDVITLIHDKAYISPSAKIGQGSIIEPMAVIHTDVNVGTGCIISAGTIINHNSVIGDGCHIDCGTVIGARTTVPAKTKTPYGAILTEQA